MKLIYDGAHEEVTVIVDDAEVPVRRGGEVEVPNDLAGREPKGEPGTDGYDPGSGLLAQEQWRKAGSNPKKENA